MNNQIISVAYSTFINKGAFALLLGSGISRKSGIPTGWEITLKLIGQLATLEKQDPKGDLAQWYKDYYKEEPDYSDILERLTNTSEERLNLLRPFIEPTAGELEQGQKTPTVAHRQIARLVKEGYIKVIVTTNFDRLLENALKDLGEEPTVISNPEHIENSIPLIHSKITIIKINGDYLDTKFLNIKSELEQYDPRLTNMLRFIFENFGLITCGWSAQWDIALVDILKNSNKFRYSNYFTYLNKVDSAINDLIAIRKGQLVKIVDADSFFTEYAENVDALIKGNDQHPLTKQVVLQRLKKYLVKEEHKILLHDLFNDIVEDYIKKIQLVDRSAVPTIELLREVRNQYAKVSDLLLVTLINTSYWSKPYHHLYIINSIKRITTFNAIASNISYVQLENIGYFPALLLRYVCGMSSIAGCNFKLLHTVLTLQIQTKYKLEPYVKLTENNSVIERENMRSIDNNSYHLPMNEFIYGFLRPYFKDLIPIDSDYESIFNYYEFINSLVYSKIITFDFFPMGRFAYKDTKIANRVLERAQKEGNKFDLIIGGFYESYDLLKVDIEKFNNHYNKIRYNYY